jgi:hypothetical protein
MESAQRKYTKAGKRLGVFLAGTAAAPLVLKKLGGRR